MKRILRFRSGGGGRAPARSFGARAAPLPVPKGIELLHHDRDLAVAVKPAGLLTQPTIDRERDTLLSRVRVAVRRAAGSCPYLAPIHRLDRLASGLVLFARTRPAQRALQRQFLDQALRREYEVVVAGVLLADRGRIDTPLIGDGSRQKRRTARPGERGKSALTRFRVLERFGNATRLEVALETGRTHQIRIHLASIGHPVLGDFVYGSFRQRPFPIELPRLALHAGKLVGKHPRTGEPFRFDAALPEDLLALLAQLRGASSSS